MSKHLMKADILVVVSNAAEARLLSNFLRQQGYKARQALDGEMGLLAIKTRKPDLILSDARLSHLDGYQMCQHLRKSPVTADIPLIFLLSAEEAGERMTALQVGGNDYLFKPYHLEELRLKMGYQLTAKGQREQLRQEIVQLQQRLRLAELAERAEGDSSEYLYLLKTAIANIHAGIVIVETTRADYPIVYVNAGFEKMTGYTFAEVVGKNCRFLQGYDREQPELVEIRHAIENRQQCRVILRNYRKEGTLFWNEISLSPILDQAGELIYYIGVQTDVTDRKRAEEELQRSRAAVAQMNRELSRLNDHLHRLANLDGLTTVANRRCFDDRLAQEWLRLSREHQPISLIIGDIDSFKLYNDTYGHLEGDDCLRAVADALLGSIYRPADLVARWGGEEFAVILPNTSLEGAREVAERMRQQIEALRIPHRRSQVADWVTMSLGVATTIPTFDHQPNELWKRADEALYLAKNQGRNRVVIDRGVRDG